MGRFCLLTFAYASRCFLLATDTMTGIACGFKLATQILLLTIESESDQIEAEGMINSGGNRRSRVFGVCDMHKYTLLPNHLALDRCA